MGRQADGDELCLSDATTITLDDDPPGALDVIACLVGQMDGRAVISGSAMVALRGRAMVEVTRAPQSDAWEIRVSELPTACREAVRPPMGAWAWNRD